eukprot:5010689-Pleurochrysis_carterae.AAC.2
MPSKTASAHRSGECRVAIPKSSDIGSIHDQASVPGPGYARAPAAHAPLSTERMGSAKALSRARQLSRALVPLPTDPIRVREVASLTTSEPHPPRGVPVMPCLLLALSSSSAPGDGGQVLQTAALALATTSCAMREKRRVPRASVCNCADP